MANGIEVQAGRTVVRAALRLAGRYADARRRDSIRDNIRPLIPARVADRLLDELSPDQVDGVSRYLGSPDFENLAVQIMFDESEDVHATVREQLRLGLRHAAALPPDLLIGMTDLLLDALIAAARKVMPELAEPIGWRFTLGVKGDAHLIAMAARNGALLSKVGSLARFHRASDQVRRQVAEHHAELRLPHVGVSRSVPWSDLYVTPSLVPEEEHGWAPSVGELTSPGQRTVILGDPGAGKSTLAAKLAHDVAADGGDRVPFLVVLRELSEALRRGERTLVEHLTAVARDPYNVDMPVDAVEYLLLNDRAVVILDGLDELTDVAPRRRISALVETFSRLYPLTPIMVTSRRVGYVEAPLTAKLFHQCLIAHFDEDQVSAYARNWFALDDAADPHQRDRLCRSFLAESASISDLRRSPLLLALLCAMYSAERFIPRNRAQVYERCAILVFDRWDSMRGITMPVQFEGRVRGAVQELAWQLFSRGAATELPQGKIRRILADFLRAKRFDDDEALALAEDFLEFCTGRAWVLTEVGTTETEPIYGFAHRTFLEYFAAERLVRHNPSPEAVWNVLAPRVFVGEWEVVGQLALQLLDRYIDDGAEKVLTIALDGPGRSHTIGFLARACGHVGLSPAVTSRVVNAAVDVARTASPKKRHTFWPDKVDFVATEDIDGPLRALTNESLQSNLAYVERALADRLESEARRDDDMALFLLHNVDARRLADDEDRVAHWHAFQVRLHERLEPHWRAWENRSPFGALFCAVEPRLNDADDILRVLDRFGPSPFYLTSQFFRGSATPTALVMLTGGDHGGPAPPAHILRRHLLTQPTPWIDGEQWYGEHRSARVSGLQLWLERIAWGHVWPSSGRDLAAFLILRLPYLETVASARHYTSEMVPGSHVAELLVDVRYRPQDLYELNDVLEGCELSPECVEFLLRWATGEISVIG